jgi:hypothetical protein
MKSTKEIVTTRHLSENHTQVEIAFPHQHGFVVTIDVPTASLDDVQQEAIRQVAELLSTSVEWWSCAIDIKRRASRASAIGRLPTRRFLMQCENAVDRVCNILPTEKDWELATFGSFARRP